VICMTNPKNLMASAMEVRTLRKTLEKLSGMQLNDL
jgi:hypothetical protein